MRNRLLILGALLLLAGCAHHYKRALPVDGDTSAPANTAPVAETAPATAVTNAPDQAPPPVLATTAPSVRADNAPIDSAPPNSPPSKPGPMDASSSDGLFSPGNAPLADKLTNTVATPAPPPAPSPTDPVIVLTTSFGKIVIELDEFAAPKTCDNFRKLVADGFYNHTTFHRVIPHFMIQGGDPNSKSDDRASYGLGGPGYALPAEIKLKHDAGAVAMARLPDSVNPHRASNGSQFYICVVPCPSLDDQYTVFGHVIAGLDVAEKIAEVPRDSRDDPNDKVEMRAAIQTRGQALP